MKIDINPTSGEIAEFTRSSARARRAMLDVARNNIPPPATAPPESPEPLSEEEEFASRKLNPTLGNRPVPGVFRPAYVAAVRRELNEELSPPSAAEHAREARNTRETERRNARKLDQARRNETSAERNRRLGLTRSGQEFD